MDNDTLKTTVPDPWRHRSDGMRCKTCMWFVPKDGPLMNYASPDPRGAIGRCRRHAPTMGGYPVVFGMDWCGDHRLDENKAPMSAVRSTPPGFSEYAAAANRAAENAAEEHVNRLRARGITASIFGSGPMDAAD